MFQTLSRYVRIYTQIFRTSLIADLEFRANFATRILVDIFWYITQIVVFEAIFLHTDRIGELDVQQTRVFLGVVFVIDAFFMIFVSESLDRFSDKVRRGDLDMLLAKPVDSQFMSSFQRANTAILTNLLLSLAWLTWAAWQLPQMEALNVVSFLVLVPCGIIVIYSIRLMLASVAVVSTNSENVQYLYWQIYRLGMRHDSIYPGPFRIVLITLLPMAMLASIPSDALFGTLSWTRMLSALGITVVFAGLSRFVWKLALRHYSSASS